MLNLKRTSYPMQQLFANKDNIAQECKIPLDNTASGFLNVNSMIASGLKCFFFFHIPHLE